MMSSSQPTSLSPIPQSDLWPCSQCMVASERASASEAECSRLADALRDAREQLELLEFRVLELEDAGGEKGNRENLTDSDSGCVSPGSRIKDSASPELRRVDSGYKSPPHMTSPCLNRRSNVSRSTSLTESSDCSELKEHLEQMLLHCDLAEDRNCLEQVLILLYTTQNSSDDETKSRKKSAHQSHKTVELTNSSDSLFGDSHKKLNFSALQESGIFEETDCEEKETQTDFVNNECRQITKEVLRLDSIRNQLESEVNRNKQPVNDALECDCVKLGKKHRQFYERRLKFLEGKISIYEAAPNVKEAKLAQRLQKEFVLESRIQELESELSTIRDKYDHMEQEFCELEELENDTRLQAQQLELECEVVKAQLNDVEAAKECSRSLAERLTKEIETRELTLRKRETDLMNRLSLLENAIPAVIMYNVGKAVGFTSENQQLALKSRIQPICSRPSNVVEVLRQDLDHKHDDDSTVSVFADTNQLTSEEITMKLALERAQLELSVAKQREETEKVIAELEMKRQQEICLAEMKIEECNKKIQDLTEQLEEKERLESIPSDASSLKARLSLLVSNEAVLRSRVKELEDREKAYLEMLTEADDMWAEMEQGYKNKIEDIETDVERLKIARQKTQDYAGDLIAEVPKQDDLSNMSLREVEEEKKVAKQQLNKALESQTELRVQLEKCQRDKAHKEHEFEHLSAKSQQVEMMLVGSKQTFQMLDDKYKNEVESFRAKASTLAKDLKAQKEAGNESEKKLRAELDKLRKDLHRSYKTQLDFDVTNGELKEEVEVLENQLNIVQRSLNQCKKRYEEKIKQLALELSQKTEELEELRSEMLASRKKNIQNENNRIYGEFIAPKINDKMFSSLSFIPAQFGSKCSCPSLRNKLVISLIDDLYDKMEKVKDVDLGKLCIELPDEDILDVGYEEMIKNYLLMAISKELVRSIGDADAKIDTKDWQCSKSRHSNTLEEGHEGVWQGARKLSREAASHAANKLAEARPGIAPHLGRMQEEVLDHSDVKVMEDQFANAIENIVNCPSCALGANAIIWSTDV